MPWVFGFTDGSNLSGNKADDLARVALDVYDILVISYFATGVFSALNLGAQHSVFGGPRSREIEALASIDVKVAVGFVL